MKNWLEVLVLTISVASFLGGVFAWYSASVVKRYAAQRDFEHLKVSYKQLADNQLRILEELDSRFDKIDLDLRDIKAQANVLMVRLLPQDSTGWMRPPGQDEKRTG